MHLGVGMLTKGMYRRSKEDRVGVEVKGLSGEVKSVMEWECKVTNRSWSYWRSVEWEEWLMV